MKCKNFAIYLMTFCCFVLTVSCADRSQNIRDRGMWIRLEEGRDCDGYALIGNKVYGVFLGLPQDYSLFDPLQGVDIPSFEVCKGSGYAKDRNHVYYPIRITCEDGLIEDSDGGEREYGGCYFQEYVIEGSDPATFNYLGNGYAVDKANMYLNGKIITWDNSVLENPDDSIHTVLQNHVDTIPIIMEEP